jgi:hypothetical protein
VKPRHLIYAVLATVIIFAAGVVTGSMVVRKTSIEPRPPQPAQGFQLARMDQLHRLVNQMDLTPDQRGKINRLVRERQEYIADLMRLIEPDMPGVFIKLRHSINQELRPDQQRRLDEMWARVEQQKKQFQNRSEFMARPGDGPMNNRPNQSVPVRSNGQRGPQPFRQQQERPPIGERQQQEPPP